MNHLTEKIMSGAISLLPEMRRLRRQIHMHPELSYEEHETARLVCRHLAELGIMHETGIAGTGIVGIIRGEGKTPGLTVGLRADMDALPVCEAVNAEYRSMHEGVMHACGHDTHIAMLLGTASLLMQLRHSFGGTVLLVFQPGEEKAPGGARLMLESGVFDKYNPDIFIAQHVIPELTTGTVGYRSGPYMASCDEIYITVTGRGGHAAKTTQYTDQIYIASEVVMTLKDTIANAARDPYVLGIGRITGLGATNIIPEKVEIAGTFRTFDEDWRRDALIMIRDIGNEIAARKGVAVDVNIVEGYPVLVNDAKLTEKAMTLSRVLLGEDKVVDMPSRMSSEDFSFFSNRFPSFLYRVGVTPEGHEVRPLHTPYFDIDESAMITGAANMTWLAVNLANPIIRGK